MRVGVARERNRPTDSRSIKSQRATVSTLCVLRSSRHRTRYLQRQSNVSQWIASHSAFAAFRFILGPSQPFVSYSGKPIPDQCADQAAYGSAHTQSSTPMAV
jgi:hypothetical protein